MPPPTCTAHPASTHIATNRVTAATLSLRGKAPRRVEVHDMQAYRPGIDETLRGDHRVCRIHGRVGMLTLPEPDAPAALHVNRRDHIHVSSGTLNRHANLAQGNEVRVHAQPGRTTLLGVELGAHHRASLDRGGQLATVVGHRHSVTRLGDRHV